MKKKGKANKNTSLVQESAPTQERYVNPFTDFGFKKLFGSEISKDLLISFLNEILPDQKIATLTYFPIQEQGQQGDWDYELKTVYTVAILDFCFEDEYAKDVKVMVKLMETEKKTVFL